MEEEDDAEADDDGDDLEDDSSEERSPLKSEDDSLERWAADTTGQGLLWGSLAENRQLALWGEGSGVGSDSASTASEAGSQTTDDTVNSGPDLAAELDDDEDEDSEDEDEDEDEDPALEDFTSAAWSWADLVRQQEPHAPRTSRSVRRWDLTSVAAAFGPIGYQIADLPLPLEALGSPATVACCEEGRRLAQLDELQVLGVRCKAGQTPVRLAKELAASHVGALVIATNFASSSAWGAIQGEGGAVGAKLVGAGQALPDWLTQAASAYARGGGVRSVRVVRSDVAYELKRRGERAERKEPILDEMQYYARYVCPPGSFGGAEEAALFEEVARIPRQEPKGRGRALRRQPVGSEREAYEAVRGEIAWRNARLTFKQARASKGYKSTPLVDFISEGVLGVLRAVDSFDTDSGYRFSTYATWWLRQRIHRFGLNADRIVRLPVHIFDKGEDGKSQIPAPFRRRPLSLDYAKFSLDRLCEAQGRELEEEQSRGLDLRDMQEIVQEALQVLPERQRSILEHRHGLYGNEPETLEEVAKRHGVTRERIRQLQARAERRLARVPALQRLFHGEPRTSRELELERATADTPDTSAPRPRSSVSRAGRSGSTRASRRRRHARDLDPSSTIEQLNPGLRAAETLRSLGVSTLGDLLALDLDLVAARYGSNFEACTRREGVQALQDQARARLVRGRASG